MAHRDPLGWLLLGSVLAATPASAADTLQELFSEGKISGHVRSYLDMRDFDAIPDQGGYALGGRLFAETGSLYGFSAGGAYYVSDDVGTTHRDEARVLLNVPNDVEILGEAYLSFSALGTRLTGGRLLIDTPFANPSDAFMVPVTFTGFGISNQSVPGLTLSAFYLTHIKDRPADEFVDIGEFVGNRLGGPALASDDTASDRGTAIAGAVYASKQSKLQAWGYVFSDYFATGYAEASHRFGEIAGVIPYAGAQYVHQFETGDELLGDVDARAFGARLGAQLAGADLSVAWNHAPEQRDAFRSGGVLAPYSFATGALFTNSMVDTIENSDSGDSLKLALVYEWGPSVVARLSYAIYDRDHLSTTRETNLDLAYKFRGRANGLTFRVRVGLVSARDRARRLADIRTQLQYAF
jgi:hypothetical protein